MYGLDLSAAFFAAGILFLFVSGLISWFGLKEPTPKCVVAGWLIGSLLLAVVTLVNFVLYAKEI